MTQPNIRAQVDKLVSANYNGWLKYSIKIKNHKDDPQDILNETLLTIYERTDEHLERILPYFEGEVKTILRLNTQSKTSGYQNKYNKIANNIQELSKIDIDYLQVPEPEINNYESVTYDEIEKFLVDNTAVYNADAWYTIEVFMMKHKQGLTYDKMSEKTGICKSNLRKAYARIRKIIKEEFKLKNATE